METKICSKCHQELPLDSFEKRGLDSYGEVRRLGFCRVCMSKYRTEARLKKKMAILAENRRCLKCGDERTYVLIYHKIGEPEGVELNINSFHRTPLDQIREQIEKTKTLCANCHKEFHYLEETQGTTIEEYLNIAPEEPEDQLNGKASPRRRI